MNLRKEAVRSVAQRDECAATDRAKALAKLDALRRSRGTPSKHWRNAGYFDVPGAVMRELAAEGLCETRKRGAAAPQEYR